jgi:hypothetical protein
MNRLSLDRTEVSPSHQNSPPTSGSHLDAVENQEAQLKGEDEKMSLTARTPPSNTGGDIPHSFLTVTNREVTL